MMTNNWIKEERKRCNLTQEMLSYLSGVPVKTIQAYEYGQRDIRKMSVDTFIKLCNALDIILGEWTESLYKYE